MLQRGQREIEIIFRKNKVAKPDTFMVDLPKENLQFGWDMELPNPCKGPEG